MSSQIPANPEGFEAAGTNREMSPGFKARIAGILYLVSVLTAVLAEFFVPGRLGIAMAVVIPISCYAAVMLLLYSIFKSVSKRIAFADFALRLCRTCL